MSDLSANDVINNVGNIITNEDTRTKGVQEALIAVNRGTAVSFNNVAPGDFVQYWMKTSAGTWFGHSGVVETVVPGTGGNPKRIKIYGAHRSQAGIGLGPTPALQLLQNDTRKIYIVRFH